MKYKLKKGWELLYTSPDGLVRSIDSKTHKYADEFIEEYFEPVKQILEKE